MKKAVSQALANDIWYFFQNSGNREVSKTCKHFVEQGKKYSTVHRILMRCIARNSCELLPRGGCERSVRTPEFVATVNDFFDANRSASVRTAAERLKVPKSTLSDAKVKDLGMHAFAKQKAPKYTNGQDERAKVGCGRILNKSRGKVIIMDDETYVPKDPQQVGGKQYYHAVNKLDVEPSDRFVFKEKFPGRYLVWQAVDGLGNVSKAYVSDRTMNWETYKNECLIKRLVPFIRRYHPEKRILFWPDMATCHYATEVTNWLAEKRILFVARRDNAPNVPQARPIERFWSLCKTAYRKRGKRVETILQMSQIWARLSKTVARKSLRKLMLGTRKKLRLIRDVSVYAPIR
jgi:hypothetical protein